MTDQKPDHEPSGEFGEDLLNRLDAAYDALPARHRRRIRRELDASGQSLVQWVGARLVEHGLLPPRKPH